MNDRKFYVLSLFLACLAAAMLGYAVSTYLEENKPLERLSVAHADQEKMEQETFTDYNEYEAQVAEMINDKGVE